MTTRAGYYGSSYTPGGTIMLLGSANIYYLSDGSQWSSGAGSYGLYGSMLDHIEVSGTTIRYVLAPPVAGLLFGQTDYDGGDHSAQGTLGASGDLVIEAQSGSTTAVLRGNALVVSNDATWYGEPRFNYYSAIVGSVVPFEMTYTISGDTWNSSTFSRSFHYSGAGSVDFAHPVSTPRPVELTISGPPRVRALSVTSFAAVARYDNGAQRNVTSIAGWTVEPAGFATVMGGILTTGPLSVPEQDLTLRATYAEGADSLAAQKSVRCLADVSAENPGAWPMFQANARHTGYLPITIDPTTFGLKWRRSLGGWLGLNPVAAGEGKVFVTLVTYFDLGPSLFALSGSDGATLWSKEFGDIFSVNPPSFGYGIVYIQTGNHYADTWLRAYEGNTGELIFKAPHDAQWERYYAPTLYDGKAYVNGGYYGGMYGFDAYSGVRLWYVGLPQMDQWTPAVDGGRAYAYVDGGLYVRDSLTGVPAPNFVADPDFVWLGRMDLAPVVGAHGDVIAINGGRLITFDPALGSIRWQVRSQFTGQPSVARDRIYAIDGGKLVVLDELTHETLWSWQAPDGDLSGPMIVTDSHVLASTAGSVHAVDLVTRASVWSYPAAGHLALADSTLYVASSDGTLTAIATCPPPPVAGNDGPICPGQTLHLTASTIAGATYSWTGPNGFASSLQNPLILYATPAASGEYRVTATAGTCALVATTTATVRPSPTALASGSATILAGWSTSLTGSGGVSCSWSPATGLLSANACSPSASPSVTTTYTLTVTDANGCVSTNNPTVTVTVLTSPIYLHQNNNSLFLNVTAPTAQTPQFKDSPSVAFGGGNPWREIGTWKATNSLFTGTAGAFKDLHAFVGLKNGDDEGTRFDVKAEVYMTGLLPPLTSGQALCVTGVTRNPDLAREVIVSLPPFAATFGPTDLVSVKVSTRIGTSGSGGSCGGHGGATGLRLYFDATSRPSRFNAGP